MKRTASRALRVFVMLLVGTVAWLATGAPAHAAEAAETYTVDATIDVDGTLHVQATIDFDEAPATLEQSLSTVTRIPGNQEYRFAISDVTATVGGAAVTPVVTVGGRATSISIPTAGASGPVVLSYVVHGAAIATPDGGTELVWGYVQGLNIPVSVAEVTVEPPALPSSVDCAAGDPAAPGACTFYAGGTHDNLQPVFHHEGLAAGQLVQGTVRFPAGSVTSNEDLRHLWTMERAFSVGPAELASALALLLLGGVALWAAHSRLGRDAGSIDSVTRIAEFHPVAEGQSEFRVLDTVRPGQVGTVQDEHVDPIDVTATLLDLAVRGHLRIEELSRPSAHAATDWSFVKLAGTDELAPYEKTLLDAVAPAGDPVQVSGLAAAVGPAIPDVQSQLYDEVVTRGWFVRRPDTTRNLWTRLGWVALALAVVATVLLAAFTTFGLIGVALILLALGLIFVAAEMPARTKSGSGVLAGLQVLSGALLSQPTDQLPKGREYEQLSRILPYAVVLGGADRWLQAIAERDDDDGADGTDLSWYHAPSDWHLKDLPASIRNFITTVQGTLFSR